MGLLLLVIAGSLLWFGPQLGLVTGLPGLTAVCIYSGWVVLLFALLRWALPEWHWFVRLLLALFVPAAIAAVVLGAWLRLARGRE